MGNTEKAPYEVAIEQIKDIIMGLEEHEQPRVLNDVYDFFYAQHRNQLQILELKLRANKETLETFKYKPIKV